MIFNKLTSGNPYSSVDSAVESHFFGSDSIESFHPKMKIIKNSLKPNIQITLIYIDSFFFWNFKRKNIL